MKRDFRGLKRWGQSALRKHVEYTAQLGRERHGPIDGPAALARVLGDRDVIRFPTRVAFSPDLPPGLFADCIPRDEDGSAFDIVVHPHYEARPEVWPLLVAYHLPSVNYGKMPTTDDAEIFGAELLGMDREVYYQTLCALADELG